jgi:hypothetical protein
VAQGRFIVHRASLREENMHEVIVDLEGMRFNDAGEIVKHGTFADVAANLRSLKGEQPLVLATPRAFARRASRLSCGCICRQ